MLEVVALLRDGVVLAETNLPNHLKHAENIGGAIASVLREAGLVGTEVHRVVAGRGPAPFTGLRVGLAAAVMFAEGAGAKLVGVVSLDAIALRAIRPGVVPSAAKPLLVTTDARRKEVYWAIYSGLNEHGEPIRIDGPGVMKPDELSEYLTDRNVHPVTTDVKISAGNLAKVFEAQLRAGTSSTDTSALYLRAADAVEPKARVPKVAGE